MMNSVLIVVSTTLFLFISYSSARNVSQSTTDDYFDADSSEITTSTLENLLTNSSSTINNNITSSLSTNQWSISRENGSKDLIIDQLNTYYDAHISSRIEKCDTNMQLNDLCEFYSFNYDKNVLVRRTIEHFEYLENIFDELINRTTMNNFKQSCFSVDTCRDNLPHNHIQSTIKSIQKYGNVFCSLEQCNSRLNTFLNSCPTLSNTGINLITLNLLPMLCSLYNQQSIWSLPNCQKELVHLFYLFYSFETHVQTCYENTSEICSTECQMISHVLNNLADECYYHAPFLSYLPISTRYQSLNVDEICDERNSSTKPRLIYFVEKYFRRRKFWYQFYNQPIYLISILVSISLLLICSCFYCRLKSKFRSKSNNRRFENDYEYARLNDQSFELANSSRISNGNSIENEMIEDESEMNSTDQLRSAEYQRLLFVNS